MDFSHLGIASSHMAMATCILHNVILRGFPEVKYLGDFHGISNWPTLAKVYIESACKLSGYILVPCDLENAPIDLKINKLHL